MTATLRGYTLRGTYADLPRSKPSPVFPAGWTGAATYTPTNAAELTTALSNAKNASGLVIIELQSGTTYSGTSWTIPAKSDGYAIVIRCSGFASLPERRVRAGDTGFAVLEFGTANPWGMTTEEAAHDVYFVGIKFTKTEASNPTTYCRFGVINGTTNPTSYAQLPTNFVLDRCWFLGAATVSMNAGIRFDVVGGVIRRSRFERITHTGADCQAVLVIQGKQIWLADNYLEASTENVMLGGGNPSITNGNVWDVWITRNHFDKPMSWCSFSAEYGGVAYVIKNLLEFKCGRRVLVEGNIIEHMWSAGQDGAAIVAKSSADAGIHNEYGTQDLTIRHNIIRNVGAVLRMAGAQGTAHYMHRVNVHNNLCYGVAVSEGVTWKSTGRYHIELAQTPSIRIANNTCFCTEDVSLALQMEPAAYPNHAFMCKDNVFSQSLGIKGSGLGYNTVTLDSTCGSGRWTVLNNVFADHSSFGWGGNTPSTNAVANSNAAIGFEDSNNDDYHLAAASAYKGTASDGGDPGCDVDLVLFHTADVDV